MGRAAVLVVGVVAFSACGRGAVGLPSNGEFGTVPRGESRSQALTLVNEGDEAVQVQLSTEGDFSVEPSSLRLAGRERAIVMGTFTPTEVGSREGRLVVSFFDRQRALILRGTGTGSRLDVTERVVLPQSFIVAGVTPGTVRAVARVRNLGTDGSTLTLGTPSIEGPPGVCLGVIAGDVCEPWVPPELASGAEVELPIMFRPSMPGDARWMVTVPSNDPVEPTQRFEVLASTQQVVRCDFELPTQLEVVDTATLAIRHRGPDSCVLDSVELLAPHPDAFGLQVSQPLPAVLTADTVVTVIVTGNPSLFTQGRLSITSLGRDPHDVYLWRSDGTCLAVSPSALDFGTVRQPCASARRSFAIYNVCPYPVALEAPVLSGSAEFRLLTPWPQGAQLPANGTSGSITFEMQYTPAASGPASATLQVKAIDKRPLTVSLMGTGDVVARNTDVYRDDPQTLADVLFMVDPSPSFLARRPSVRANLEEILRGFENVKSCRDTRVAIAPADGDPNANVQFVRSDAGASWTSTSDPAFVARVLGAFDALPVGSEIEACAGPAADLITDAGLTRRFAGFCITDALEQTPAPAAALQRIKDLTDGGTQRFSWSVVGGTDAACGVEAVDDGVHASLLTPGMTLDNVCNESWSSRYLFGGCGWGGPRLEYFLTSRPSGNIEVRIDTVLLASSDWTYDSTNNSVRILVPAVPEQRRTIEISYDVACVP
jgi:hypothetical protein